MGGGWYWGIRGQEFELAKREMGAMGRVVMGVLIESGVGGALQVRGEY
jgi:hypothetical protein